MPKSCATRAEFLSVLPEFRTFGPTSTGQVTVNFATAGDTFTITSGNELLPKSITFTGSFTPTLGTEFQSDASPEEIAASLAASINVRGELCKASHVGAVIYLESIETGVDGLHTLSCAPLAAFTLPPDGKLTGGAALIDQALACACSQINLECWGKKAQCAHIYLTAHMLTVAAGGEAGPVESRKIDKIEEKFGTIWNPDLDPSFGTTKWGRLYLQLKSTLLILPVAGRRHLVAPGRIRGWWYC